jgi:hypothetical protein
MRSFKSCFVDEFFVRVRMRADSGRNSFGRIAVLGSMVCVLIAAFSGCRQNDVQLYPVHGKVTYSDGAPLSDGWVSFRPIEGENKVTARGQIRSDGTFELTTFEAGDGAVSGRNQVLVMPPTYGDREGPQAARPKSFDRHFSNFATSGLEFDVTDDPNKNQFEIVVR